jgi:hypothetical protein
MLATHTSDPTMGARQLPNIIHSRNQPARHGRRCQRCRKSTGLEKKKPKKQLRDAGDDDQPPY